MDNTRILIVEDDADIANMLKFFFTGKGYIVDVAPNGKDALEQSLRAACRVVILDIILPGLDGFEVCRRMRAHPRTNHIPIVFLSQMDELRDKAHGLELGADDYITKPFYIHELLSRVEYTLARAERQKLVDALTGLPGPKKIEDCLHAALQSQGWAVLDVLVEGLPLYRNAYGEAAGDDILRATARLMVETLNAAGRRDDFIGHTGGGAFEILTDEEVCESVRRDLQERFQDEIAAQARQSADIASQPTQPEPPPTLSLSFAQVRASTRSYADLSDLFQAIHQARAGSVGSPLSAAV